MAARCHTLPHLCGGAAHTALGSTLCINSTARLANGQPVCTKVECQRCFLTHGWDWAAADADPRWQCTQCRCVCPRAGRGDRHYLVHPPTMGLLFLEDIAEWLRSERVADYLAYTFTNKKFIGTKDRTSPMVTIGRKLETAKLRRFLLEHQTPPRLHRLTARHPAAPLTLTLCFPFRRSRGLQRDQLEQVHPHEAPDARGTDRRAHRRLRRQGHLGRGHRQ